jgi:carboxypeptidase Q
MMFCSSLIFGIKNLALLIPWERLSMYSRLFAVMLVALLWCSSTPVFSQQPVSAKQPLSEQTVSELQRIQQAALASDYAYRQLAHLTDSIGPRLTGSPQAEKAVEYVAAEMRKLGAEVQLEKLTVPHWIRGEETAALVEFPGMASNTTQKLILTALGGSVATPTEGITADVIVAKTFDELIAFGHDKVQGKIVLFTEHFDQRMAAQGFGGEAYRESVIYRAVGANVAARLGAIACVIRSVGGAQYRVPHTGSLRYQDDVKKIPAAAVTAEDADMIERLAPQGRVRMHLTLTPKTLPDATSYNVIADLKGTEHPEDIVVVSGHLDSWDLGTGAIDDGAGVVAAMQTLQVLKQLGLRPKRTIRMIAWMNEENGVVGGRTYAANHATQVLNHVAMIESDRGADHPMGFEIKGSPEILPLLTQVSNVLRSQGAGLLKIVDDSETDVSPMAEKGVPAIGLWQDNRTYFDFHHTPADTLDKVDPKLLAENCSAMAVMAYALSSLDQRLPRLAVASQ